MLFCALIALVWQASSSSPDWSGIGLKALEEKRFEAAAEAFQKAVDAEPKDYFAHFNLAMSNALLKRDDAAIAGYRRVLELKPGLFEAELNAGVLLLRNGRAAEAVPLLEDARSQKPREFRPVYLLAEALLDSKKYPAAEQAFTAALQLDEKDARAEAGLARALLAQNRLDESAPHFRRAAELDPAQKDGLLELGNAYESAKRVDEALAVYKEFPDNVAVRERSGQLLLSLGRAEEAIPHLRQAVERSPTQANRAALAAAYMSAKDLGKGEAVLAEALSAEPANYDLRMMAGRLFRDQRKFPEAAAQFLHAARVKPESVSAWSDLAGVLVLAERYGEAVAALDRVRALGGETSAHVYFRALSLDHLNQVEPALAAYRRFLELSGGKRPDEEFKARQRARVLEKEMRRR